MLDFMEQRELVAKACRMIGNLGLTKAATGHISARVDGGFLIRARGPDEVGVRYTTAEQIIKVDMDGNKLDGPDGLKSPQEVYIHSWQYKTRPEVNSVNHVHPAMVVLFTITEKKIMPIFGAYDPTGLRLAVEGPSLYDRAVLIKNDALGQELATAMGRSRICLMRGHGITTVGASVEEATLASIKINELAEMNYQAYLLGQPRPISDEDIRTFIPGYGEAGGGNNASATLAPLMGNVGSSWRYYATLAGEKV
ncbi:MAG: ribulose-5-phosphate 4-epimerase/fuculose-1-phosphate aldolase [Alphaproteobacteria bacterium]|jgi:ribulose-5-phosphate 4-epimerase/fuculose-1-phosphate aldolase